MAKKIATNETMIKDLFKDLNGIELALLRERIVMVMDVTKQSIENDPTQWEKSIIHPSLYMGLYDKVQKHIGFNDK
jgi:hypothetical protein